LYREFVIGGLIAVVLSACAVVDPVHPRSDTIDRSLERARNESILLNIVRASHQWPLNFTAIAQVSPSAMNQTTLGLPNFLTGPGPVPLPPGRDVIFDNNSFSNALTVSSNFSISSLNTGTFYRGLLNPVDLHDLNYFIRQNYPRELLFWLFTDTVELIKPRKIGFHYDPPNDYGCAREDPKQRCFREWVEIAVITGLTVEAKTIQRKVDDKITTKEYSRFCFDRVLAEQGKRAMDPARLYILKTRYLATGLRRSPQCNEPWSPGARGREEESDTLFFYFGPYTFRILTRSTNSIYQFLGQLLRQQRDHIPPAQDPYIPPLEEAGPPTLSTRPYNPELLTIVPEQPGVRCFAHTYFFDGDYCVPEHGAENTKRIFSLLAELLALKTMANELAITPLVRVVP
jgi:hypothetical protein